MAITLVGVAEAQATDGSAVTVTLPAGTTTNDVVYVCQGNAAAGTVDPGMTTTGYTLIATQGMNNANGNLSVYRKIQGGTPDTTVQVGTGSNNFGHPVVAIVLRGIDTTTPEDATATKAFGASTNPNPAAIITVTDHAWVLPFMGTRVNDTTVTAPSGYSNQVDINSNGATNPATAGGATLDKTPLGNEDPAAWTNVTTANWATITVAVRPASTAQQATVSLNGAGSLAATATLVMRALASFAGAGSLSATASLAQQIAATFAGTGNLSATSSLALRAAATFAGVGSLSVSTSLALRAAAQFAGASSLTVSTLARIAAFATFAGTGSLSATASLALVGRATFAGAGAMSVAMRQNALISAQFAGAGSLLATATRATPALATFNGAGSLRVSAGLALQIAATFAGSGSLVANMVQAFLNNPINFAGAGSLSVIFFGTVSAYAIFGGLGHFCINGTIRIGSLGPTSNVAVTGPGTGSNTTGTAAGVRQNTAITGPGPTGNVVV